MLCLGAWPGKGWNLMFDVLNYVHFLKIKTSCSCIVRQKRIVICVNDPPKYWQIKKQKKEKLKNFKNWSTSLVKNYTCSDLLYFVLLSS